MKKMIALIAAAVFPMVGMAAAGAITSGAQILNAQCAMIPASNTDGARIQLSRDVIGAYSCSSTAAGVAAGHPQGKKVIFSANSGGGAVTKTEGNVPSSSNVGSAADTALSSAAGSS